MKRAGNFLLSVVLLTTILSACKKDNAPADGPFDARLYNCNGNKNSNSPYICFDSLITESRCPSDANVQCIWSGYALIKVSFHENGNTHIFKMVTPLLHLFDAVNDTTINGYRLVLKTLSPYPNTNNGPVADNDRKATIEITK